MVFFLVMFLLMITIVQEMFLFPVDNSSIAKSRNMRLNLEHLDQSLVESIASGTNLALIYCQHAFYWDRWNCPGSTFNRRTHSLPTKEVAYTKAILAAGIVHAVTKNCSRGVIKSCGCDQKLGVPSAVAQSLMPYQPNNENIKIKNQTKWSWGGCSDHPSYALRVAEAFLNGFEKGTDVVSYVGRHNSKVGREIVRDNMVQRCRCHGVSGSCTIQTCWMQLTTFGEISRKLKERYKKSVRLIAETLRNNIILGNSPKDTMIKEKEIPEIRNSLVYLEQSPDYCIENITEGIPGTRGRKCTKNINATITTTTGGMSKAERNSCRNLCKKCGYSVRKTRRQVTKKCKCTFLWCCTVKCESCIDMIDEYFCE